MKKAFYNDETIDLTPEKLADLCLECTGGKGWTDQSELADKVWFKPDLLDEDGDITAAATVTNADAAIKFISESEKRSFFFEVIG